MYFKIPGRNLKNLEKNWKKLVPTLNIANLDGKATKSNYLNKQYNSKYLFLSPQMFTKTMFLINL